MTGTRRISDGFGWPDGDGYSRAVRPASTMVYVAGLVGDGFLVEIEAQAVVEP